MPLRSECSAEVETQAGGPEPPLRYKLAVALFVMTLASLLLAGLLGAV